MQSKTEISQEIKQERIKRLTECLQESGLTQKQLSTKMGYTPQMVSQVMRGKKVMSDDFAYHAAKALEVRKDYLLGVSNWKTDAGRNAAADGFTDEMVAKCHRWEKTFDFIVHLSGLTLAIKPNEDTSLIYWNGNILEFSPWTFFYLLGVEGTAATARPAMLQWHNDAKIYLGDTEMSFQTFMEMINDLEEYSKFLLHRARVYETRKNVHENVNSLKFGFPDLP